MSKHAELILTLDLVSDPVAKRVLECRLILPWAEFYDYRIHGGV